MPLKRSLILLSIFASSCASTPLPPFVGCVSDPKPSDPAKSPGLRCARETTGADAIPAPVVTVPFDQSANYFCFPPKDAEVFIRACGARIRTNQ